MQLSDAIATLAQPSYRVRQVDLEDAARTILQTQDRTSVLPWVSQATRIVAAAVKADRVKARRRSRRSQLRDVADSLGLTVVRGAVSGRLYLE